MSHWELGGALWDYSARIRDAANAADLQQWENYADALVAAKRIFDERVSPLHTEEAYWTKVDPAIWTKVNDDE